MSSVRMNQTRSDVARVYRFGGARWYDGFRRVWTRVTSRSLEKKFDQALLETAKDGCAVLDIGCGTGFGLERLCRLGIPFGSYLGVDLTDAMLAIARERYADEPRAAFVEANLTTLAGTSEQYDLVMSTWVASHLDRPRELFELIEQALTPSGQAFVLMMTRPSWYIAWWFSPFARLFRTRFVDLASLGDLPGMATIETGPAGLATLVLLRKGAGPQKTPPLAPPTHAGGKP